ncbi:MAG TPA: sigma-70 family RNA polymerase sigma factor [Polyangiaceae bacterium]|nr:sigma-70 family RNA polymerase sigma factor [Polyangiaceae bacterium]
MAAADLESFLDAIVHRVRATWPQLGDDTTAFRSYLRSRLPDDPSVAVDDLALGDLYLAFACLQRDPAALAVFEAQCLAEVGAYVAHIDRAPAFVDEVRQALRASLLVGGEGNHPPGLEGYRGRGALGGFVRVAAVRVALNFKRQRRRASARDEASAREGFEQAALSPELTYLRDQYRDVFAEAMRAAVAALADRDRALLRLYHSEGLALEELAALFRVHASTASRWLARARERVAQATMRGLRERLQVGSTDADSIATLVMSQLDFSLSRLFRDAP